MNEPVPTNPEVLRWARESSGYSINEVVVKLRQKTITKNTIESWENGAASPTYTQLERLAYEIYKRPLALFFFPSPPEEEAPKTSFRTLPQEKIQKLNPKLLYLVRKAQAMRENIIELFDGINSAKRKICTDIKIREFNEVVGIAKNVRERFGVSLHEQYELRNSDSALKFWRNILEENGMFVFKDAFEDDNCSGFCLHHEVFPIIYINNSMAKERQIFTLFHELAHLLFETGGVDFRDDNFIQNMEGENRNIEFFCNKFAGEFLVPINDIKKQIPTRGAITDALLAELAKKYSVSREVILIKTLDMGKIDQRFYKEKKAEWEQAKLAYKSKSGGNFYRTQKVYLSDYYTNMVFKKFYGGAISKTKLADYLSIPESGVDTFERFVFNWDATL